MNEVLKLKGKLQVLGTLEDIQRLTKNSIRLAVSREQLEKLEESNELFAAATEDGFSKETIRKIIEPALDYFFERINWEKIQSSKTMQMAALFCDELDFSSINGAYCLELADSKGILDGFLDPEFKKQYIFSEATKLVVEKGNISFQTAVKRTIAKVQSGDFISSEIEIWKKSLSDFADLINPLIDFYLENEEEFIKSFITSKCND